MKMHENELLMIQPNDNVAVALKALSKGSECSVGGKNIILKDDIPAAHKVALTEIGKDENVIKYGLPIGHAISPIHMGEHVHIHNMTTNLEGLLEYQYHPEPDLWKNRILMAISGKMDEQERETRFGLFRRLAVLIRQQRSWRRELRKSMRGA